MKTSPSTHVRLEDKKVQKLIERLSTMKAQKAQQAAGLKSA
jgi:hypothetical protein